MAPRQQKPPAQPACRRCRHYFITYDPSRPYGCRAMGFKSRHNPALVVFSTSGLPCQLFREKKSGTPGRDDQDTPGY